MNRRTLLRNEVELSPKRFLAEGSTKGVSAQDLRPKFQPIYQLQQLAQEGREFDEQAIAALSPYIRHHINRFGHYQFDLAQQSPPLDYDLSIPTKKRQEKSPGQATVAKRKKKPKKKHKKTTARQMKLFEGEESL